MNKRVRKHLNEVDDCIATAKERVDAGDFAGAALALDGAKGAVHLAAAEQGKAKRRHEASRFAQNGRSR